MLHYCLMFLKIFTNIQVNWNVRGGFWIMNEDNSENNQSIWDELIARRRGYHEDKRYREVWSPEEIEMLRKSFNEGHGISEIAVLLQRSERAVFQRLQQEDLFREINKKNPENQNINKCKCKKCELKDSCPKNNEFCSKSTMWSCVWLFALKQEF